MVKRLNSFRFSAILLRKLLKAKKAEAILRDENAYQANVITTLKEIANKLDDKLHASLKKPNGEAQTPRRCLYCGVERTDG
jgi:hypothetical protein